MVRSIEQYLERIPILMFLTMMEIFLITNSHLVKRIIFGWSEKIMISDHFVETLCYFYPPISPASPQYNHRTDSHFFSHPGKSFIWPQQNFTKHNQLNYLCLMNKSWATIKIVNVILSVKLECKMLSGNWSAELFSFESN